VSSAVLTVSTPAATTAAAVVPSVPVPRSAPPPPAEIVMVEPAPQPIVVDTGAANNSAEGQIYYMLVDENSQLDNHTILIGKWITEF
jgi:hypothetical protein